MNEKALKLKYLACSACQGKDRYYKMHYGTLDKRFMLIGQNPGYPLMQEGYPFDWSNAVGDINRSGRLIDRAFAVAGLDKAEFYVTNAVKCAFKQLDLKEKIFQCQHLLEAEILSFKGDYVLILSKAVADYYSCKIGEMRDLYGKPTFASYHPSFYIRNGDEQGFVNQMKAFSALVKKKRKNTLYDFIS